MNCRILEAQDLAGLLLVRNKADLSAAFLLPHLLHLALSANLRVVLLLAQDSILHYQSALRKLGINLAASIQAAKVTAINATASTPTSDYFRDIVQQVAAACDQPQQPGASAGVCLLIDSVSALAGLKDDEQHWQAFLHYCQVPPWSLQGQYACVMSVHDDIEADTPWIKWLRHQAQIEIEVVALESGPSPDINGQVVVTRRQPASTALGASPSSSKAEALQDSQHMSFKLGPSDVRFFQ